MTFFMLTTLKGPLAMPLLAGTEPWALRCHDWSSRTCLVPMQVEILTLLIYIKKFLYKYKGWNFKKNCKRGVSCTKRLPDENFYWLTDFS